MDNARIINKFGRACHYEARYETRRPAIQCTLLWRWANRLTARARCAVAAFQAPCSRGTERLLLFVRSEECTHARATVRSDMPQAANSRSQANDCKPNRSGAHQTNTGSANPTWPVQLSTRTSGNRLVLIHYCCRRRRKGALRTAYAPSSSAADSAGVPP